MNPTLDKEASYFLTCMKDGFTQEQKEAFALWIKQSPLHEKAFEDVKKLTSFYRALPQNKQTEVIEHVHAEIKRERIFKRRRVLAMAASLLIFFCAISYERYLAFFVPHHYSTQKERQHIILPDDSTVLLDAKTKASIRCSSSKREVLLEKGKVLLSVTKNPDKPFWVQTGGISIKVLGTRFEVEHYDDHVDISVLEGIVSVQKGEEHLLATLTKGEKLSYLATSDRILLQKVAPEMIASWKEGVLRFQNETLYSAIDAFSYYHDLNISLQPELENQRISGSFAIDEVDKFLYALSKIYTLNVRKIGDTLYIQKKQRKNN
ncbi:FecR family protein [Sulfurospirillum deleyianum]|uniref:FecR protein n=1 Tax=Sulfurospirillum deleyianum (strain ATCC 51133 / DSM 6946 / 5175) TaxID=525898 RepID=D1B2C8_SULD5|nr:FecR domain-containing protein [Sulfurospirillum deleyianum]ACZ12248.1 FecR protein [Sulfurospirillum deleyianum DSM 6946]